VCPGTSTWCSFTGRTWDRQGNLLAAARDGLAGGATGYLATVWGDYGYRQQWPLELHALAEAAHRAWSGTAPFSAQAAGLHARSPHGAGAAQALSTQLNMSGSNVSHFGVEPHIYAKGLQLLEREKQVFLAAPTAQPELEGHEQVVGAFLKPEARVDMVGRFREFGLKPTAMMDISDGLASEIFHICKQSGTGALVEEAQIPIHKDAYELASLTFRIDPTVCALNGGEDYELLFTVSPEDLDKVRIMPSVYIIGEIKPLEAGIKIHSKGDRVHDIEAQGWVHF
jgi:hypothetical protein